MQILMTTLNSCWVSTYNTLHLDLTTPTPPACTIQTGPTVEPGCVGVPGLPPPWGHDNWRGHHPPQPDRRPSRPRPCLPTEHDDRAGQLTAGREEVQEDGGKGQRKVSWLIVGSPYNDYLRPVHNTTQGPMLYCVALRYTRICIWAHRNTTKRKDGFGSYPCVPLHYVLTSGHEKSQIYEYFCVTQAQHNTTQCMRPCIILWTSLKSYHSLFHSVYSLCHFVSQTYNNIIINWHFASHSKNLSMYL